VPLGRADGLRYEAGGGEGSEVPRPLSLVYIEAGI
jgi:hypothetical protein